MIYDEIKHDAEEFTLWADLNDLTRNQIEREMFSYIIDLCADDKIDVANGYATEWVSDTRYAFTFLAVGAIGIQCVYFDFSHLVSNVEPTSSNYNDAYDRAMRGI